MRADASKADLDGDNPVSRIESLLTSIATNSAAMRRAYDVIYDMKKVIDEVKLRQDAVVKALDEFDMKYVSLLKQGPRHAAFKKEVMRAKAVLGHGMAVGSDDSEHATSVESLIGRLTKIHAEIAKSPLMQSGKSFVEPVSHELEELRPIYQEIHKLLITPLSKTAEPIAVGSLADNDGWVSLLMRISNAPEEDKVRLVSAAMVTAAEDMGRIARQVSKLNDRAEGNGSTAAEREAARKRTYALNRSIDALRKRMVALSASFYSKRQRTLAGLVDATKSVGEALQAHGVTIETIRDAKAFRNKHGIQRLADDLIGLDASLDRGKGTNPTLGNLMRYYHDNAQRRISHG